MYDESFRLMPTKARTVTASSFLSKQFNGGDSDIDWEKLKTQVIGLPATNSLLVNKAGILKGSLNYL